MNSQAVGKRGEDYARELLREMGHTVVAANVSSPYGEVDIITSDKQHICFVEVKARKRGSMVSGTQAVSLSKQRKIIATALWYLQRHPCDLQPRFDVVSIILNESGQPLSHDYLTGAFDGEAYERYADF